MPAHQPLIGIVLMLLSTAVLAVKDGVAKTFLDVVSPVLMIWFQFVGSFVILAALTLPKYGWRVLTPVPLGGQFVRGALSAGAVSTLYWSLSHIPIADATAMFMLAPIVVTVLSPALLGEAVGVRRMLAVAVGFLGVLVILRPGFGGEMAGYYIGLLAGVIMGFYFMANRKLAGRAPPVLSITHNCLMGGVALSLFLPLFWTTPPAHVTPKLAAIVVLAIAGQGLMISAFAFAPAGVVAPISYAMLVFAALIGYFAFGTLPDTATWAGMTLIVGAGLFIAWRERQLAALRSKAALTPP